MGNVYTKRYIRRYMFKIVEKKLLAENSSPEAFAEAMKKAYPGLPGEANLADLGKALYK